MAQFKNKKINKKRSKASKRKLSPKGCLAIFAVVGLVAAFLASQQVYFLRQHSGYTRLLGNDEVLYLVVGTNRMGDRCSLLTEVASLFMWQPSARRQGQSVKVVKISRAGLESFTHEDMSVNGSFFLDGKDLVYLKTKSRYEQWHPVQWWRGNRWDILPESRAKYIQSIYSDTLNRRAEGKRPRVRFLDVSHSSLWSRRETRFTLQGQSFSFKTTRRPSAGDSEREKIKLEVQGLYGFHETLIDEDQAWRAVSRADYEAWFSPLE